jgi:predicted  nucleic acid-binding Zn-ribbon protein
LLAREATAADVDRQLEELAPQQGDIGGRQKRLEDELAGVEEKIAEVDAQLYSGTVTSPRELQALQADVESLKRHRSSLEDELLEAMAEAEPLDADAGKLLERRRELEHEIEGLQAAVDEASGGIGTELAEEEAARDKSAAALPSQLLSLYESLRQKLGGVGAARLESGACGGCHMKLPAIELDAIKHQAPEVIVRCDQCGRILVR